MKLRLICLSDSFKSRVRVEIRVYCYLLLSFSFYRNDFSRFNRLKC